MKLTGQRLGRYAVLRPLGIGRVGTLYLAEVPQSRSLVTVRLLPSPAPLGAAAPPKADASDAPAEAATSTPALAPAPAESGLLRRRLIDRLQAKQELLLQLHHPRIVRMEEPLRLADDGWLLVMEHVPGKSLAQHLQAMGRLHAPLAVRLTMEVLEGLAYAHGRGVVHEDLTPNSVLLDMEGHARLTDFALPPSIPLSPGDPRPPLAGTPAYLSPEQARGHAPDALSNVYATGLLLYEMLAGRPAFAGPDAAAILERQLGSPPLPLGEVRAGIDSALAAVVRRAIAKEPQARFQSAVEMCEALSALPAETPADEVEILALATLTPMAGTSPQEGETFLPLTGFAAPARKHLTSEAAFMPGLEEGGPHLRSTTVLLAIVLTLVLFAAAFERSRLPGSTATHLRNPAAELYSPAPPGAATESGFARIRTAGGRVYEGMVERLGADGVRLVGAEGKALELPLAEVADFHPLGGAFQLTAPRLSKGLGRPAWVETRTGKRLHGFLQACYHSKVVLVLEGGPVVDLPVSLVRTIEFTTK
ncbi:MAG: serine/threonine protein kinase [Planctomycetes bacterium]|nr:serine/threonine protein kinase [Planctomycetota bacterium]